MMYYKVNKRSPIGTLMQEGPTFSDYDRAELEAEQRNLYRHEDDENKWQVEDNE